MGVKAYASEKDVVDAGELAGIARAGVAATTDLATALATPADCVIHVARDFGSWRSNDELLALCAQGTTS